MATTSISHLEICAGYGGVHIGLKRALSTVRLVAAVEIEAYACVNLLEKMEIGWMDSAPIWTDVKTFDGQPFRGVVDILSAGFPCQPFSCAGKRAADEDARHLWPHILRSIIAIRPGAVFLENVEGIISSKLGGEGWTDAAGTPVLLHVLRELERVGYRCAWGIFSASEVGASHRRKRVFILGVADGQDILGRLQLCAGVGRSGDEPAGRREGLADTFRSESPGRRVAGDLAGASGGAQGEGCERERLRDSARDGRADVDHSSGSRCDGAGQRAATDIGGGECLSREGCEIVADAGRAERREETEREDAEWRLSNESADRDCERGGSLGDSASDDERRHQLAGSHGAQEQAGGSNGHVEHADESGREECRSSRESSREMPAVERASLQWIPEFPPGPGEIDEWARILATRPDLAPAIEAPAQSGLRGLANAGQVGHRVDRLRAAGNGVVPHTVERAFRTLVAELLRPHFPVASNEKLPLF